MIKYPLEAKAEKKHNSSSSRSNISTFIYMGTDSN